MALFAGGDKNLCLTIRMQQLFGQDIDVLRLVTVQLQINQSTPDAGVLDRSGSPQAPQTGLNGINLPALAFRILRIYVSLTLRAAREDAGLTQAELAERVGVRQATISDLETGKSTRIDFDLLDRLCDVLGVEPGELLERDKKRKRGS